MSTPTVCVIGAGISGLTAGKMLSDYAIPYVCFEAGDRVGGNWAFGNPNGRSSAYASLHIDTSKQGLRLRDFPIDDAFPDYPHHTQIKAYLDAYADAFGLRERIRFDTPVSRCHRLPGGGWQILTGDGEEHRADVLVVGNGHHWDPRYPDFPGRFDGETIHSHHYRAPDDPLPLRGKRVLVVGIGNSGSDIVSELALKSNAAQVFLSTRSGAWVVPKYVGGRPLDEVVGTVPWLPLGPQRYLARLLPRLISGDMRGYGLPKPDHHFLQAHPTVSSELLLRLGSGDAVAKPDVERLAGHQVHFVDGSVESVDAIIYATGYNISFPFFDPAFISAPENRIRLYKRMFKPGIDDLVFIGLAQALPTLFPFIELQSQLMARYLAGTWRPPPEDEMERVIDAEHAAFAAKFTDKPRHTQQVDWAVYERDIVSREIPAGRRRAEQLGPVQLVRGREGTVSVQGFSGDHGAPATVRIPVGGPGSGDELGADLRRAETPIGGRRTCVVMAHGFANTRDSGLPAFARDLCGAGVDVLSFDYRGFGDSSGEPLEIDPAGQREDYHAAIAYARALPEMARIVLWGVSYSGGHVLQVAAEDAGNAPGGVGDPAAAGACPVAAVISLTPAPDGLASFLQALRNGGPRAMLLTGAGVRDQLAAQRGSGRVRIPAIGAPGTLAPLTAPGALEGAERMAGPTFRNEVNARIALVAGSYRPTRQARGITCPTLVQVADEDRSAPPKAAMKAAWDARAEVRHYPCDHFDVYLGGAWYQPVVDHQLEFLQRHLGAT